MDNPMGKENTYQPSSPLSAFKLTHHRKPGHVCTLSRHKRDMVAIEDSEHFKGLLGRMWLCYKRVTTISENHPRCGQFYRSRAEIALLKKQQTLSRSLIIHPLSMLYYEIYMTLILTCCMFFFPFEGAFCSHRSDMTGRMIKVCVLVFLTTNCFVDIVMTFLSGWCDEKEKTILLDRWGIARHYIFGFNFISDVLSSMPGPFVLCTVMDLGCSRNLEILLFFRIFRFRTTFVYINRTAEFFRMGNKSINIVNLILFTVLFLHWLACLHYVVPQFRKMSKGNIDNTSWVIAWFYMWKEDLLSKYLRCLYKSVGYTLCIRFEPITLTLWEELILACVSYCLGKFFVIYLTVKLVQILMERTSLETKYEELMEQVDSYMVGRRLPIHMRTKLVQNYKYKYRGIYFKENKITALLPEQLKREVNAEALVKLSRSVAIFQDLPRWKLEQVLAHLKVEIFMPNDVIIRSGSGGDCMYFLYSGTVVVYTPSGKEVCHLSDGAYFGEISLLLKDVSRTATVVALEISEVYKMTKRGFHSCFKDNKDMLKKIKEQAVDRLDMTQMLEDLYQATFQERERKRKGPAALR